MPPGLNPQRIRTSSARPPSALRMSRSTSRIGRSRGSPYTRCASAAPFRTRKGTPACAIAPATSATTRVRTAAACACCVRLARRRARRSAGIARPVRSMCASTSGSMPCCSAAIASSSNDGTADSADGSRCATAADPGGCAHSDKNRNAPSDSVAIYHEIVTKPLAALTPFSCTTAVAPGAANDEPPPPPPPPAPDRRVSTAAAAAAEVAAATAATTDDSWLVAATGSTLNRRASGSVDATEAALAPPAPPAACVPPPPPPPPAARLAPGSADETTAGAAVPAGDMRASGFSAPAPAAADDHERGGAVTHARSAPAAAATESGASAASVEAADSKTRSWPPTSTVSDAPGVTDTVAVVRPPRPPVPPAAPNPGPPDAPVARIVMLTTPAGTTKVSGPPVKLNVVEPGVGRLIVKVCAAARPAGRRDRHRAGTGGRGQIEHEAGGQRRTAAHDDVGDRHAATADGHRRGADDEIGARQRDRHRLAPDALIRRDARQRRRRRTDCEGLRSACPAGGCDRHRAGTNSGGRIEHEVGGQRRSAAHDDVGDCHAAAARRSPSWRRRRNWCPSA